MILKPSKESARPESFAKTIWESKQPLARWPSDQVSTSFFLLFILEKMWCSWQRGGAAEPGLILELRTRTLGSSPVSASESLYPSLLPPVGLSFPICKMQEWTSLISPSPSNSSSPCQIIFQVPIHSAYWPLPTWVSLAAGNSSSRTQVPETSLSLWKPERRGSWGYFSIAANLRGQPQMSVLIKDPLLSLFLNFPSNLSVIKATYNQKKKISKNHIFKNKKPKPKWTFY